MRRSRGELEALIMNALWDADDWLTPRDVQDLVTTPRQPLAYTTVMTILVRLFDKGMVDRHAAGRAYAYRPVATREQWAAERMHDILVNAGDPLVALNRFVDSIDSKQARQLRKALDARKPR